LAFSGGQGIGETLALPAKPNVIEAVFYRARIAWLEVSR